MTVWGTNNPKQIFAAIYETFGVDIALEVENKDERWKTEFGERLFSAISDCLDEDPYRTVANQMLGGERDVLFKVRIMIGMELAREDATLMQSDKKRELLMGIDVVFQSIERAFSEFSYYQSEGAHHSEQILCRQETDEDQQEGPTDNAFLFQVNGHGRIVAVERPDIVARRLESVQKAKQEIPF
jgi:hypothetical protein